MTDDQSGREIEIDLLKDKVRKLEADKEALQKALQDARAEIDRLRGGPPPTTGDRADYHPGDAIDDLPPKCIPPTM